MTRWRALLSFSFGVVAAAGLAAQDTQRPSVAQVGRATVLVRHGSTRAVVAYDYSQRYHAQKWLLLNLGLSTRARLALRPGDVALVTPDGYRTPLPSRKAFLTAAPRILALRQQAQVWHQYLSGYMTRSLSLEPIRFFGLPGEGSSTTRRWRAPRMEGSSAISTFSRPRSTGTPASTG
jgi:hypothetical protein